MLSKKVQAIKDHLAEINPDAILYDGCDDALIGTATRVGLPTLACYDYDLLVESFMKDRDGLQGMDDVEAMEWVEFNIVGAFLGPHTPIIQFCPDAAEDYYEDRHEND
jgi:hypothetical protein